MLCHRRSPRRRPRAQDRGPAGTVTLSRTDYDRLLDLAARQPRPPDGAPLPAALTRADIRARVDAGIVRATMTVEGEVFQTGAVKVPLISNATLLDARIGGSAAAAPRRRQLRTSRSSPARRRSRRRSSGDRRSRPSPGRGSFVLPVPPAGSATATFDVPGEQSDLRVSPGLVLRRTSAAGRTIDRSDARSGIGDAGLVVGARDQDRPRCRATCACSRT